MAAGINDIGGADPDTLETPPLGGPDGWAAAVAKALNNDDKTVNQRITDHEAKADPHPGYATDSDLASVAGSVPTAITDHEAKADPHPGYLKPSEIVAGANITVTENAGVVTIAGQAGGGGGGGGGGEALVASVVKSATQSGITTEVAVSDMSITFDATAGKTYRIAGQLRVKAYSGGRAIVRLYRGTTQIAVAGDHTAGTPESWGAFSFDFVDAPSVGGSTTYSLKMASVGTGAVDAEASATGPWQMSVFDTSGGGGASTLDDLTDVDTTGAVDGQVLGFDGTAWVPVDQAAGGGGSSNAPGVTHSGAVVTKDGDDFLYTFLADGAISFASSMTVDVLVIGGGGSGSGRLGGGGGAGELVDKSIAVAASTVTVTIGAGGLGQRDAAGADGSPTVFGPYITANGGGGGSVYAGSAGRNGGSGGGHTYAASGAGGLSVLLGGGVGNKGGNGNSNVSGAGGGGAGGAGQDAQAGPRGGNGGAGAASSISGVPIIYAGGGGGAGGDSGMGGTGGSGGGGGGVGGNDTPAVSGLPNTGSGGGACRNTGAAGSTIGGDGGSGLVIVRVAGVSTAPTLDSLSDVSAPADTPAGKVLGTTAEGVWGPVDPPAGGGGGDVTVAHAAPTEPPARDGLLWVVVPA